MKNKWGCVTPKLFFLDRLTEIIGADFLTYFVADFCIFMSFKSVGKSFGVTQALFCNVIGQCYEYAARKSHSPFGIEMIQC